MRFLILIVCFTLPLLAQPESEAGGKLLLRDYTQTVISQDVHFHMDPDADPAKVALTMDQLNIRTIVNLGRYVALTSDGRSSGYGKVDLARWLDSYKHSGRQPGTACEFLIMFRVLETDDEYFDRVEPSAGIPDEVLEKIYRLNARKVLRLP